MVATDTLTSQIMEPKKRFAVHRLVAEHYLEGTGEVVHHKDGNTLNNNVENLEWTTQRENIRHSYKKMSQVRNYRECQLLKDGVPIGHFQSISEACRYASKHYGVSFSSLSKYGKSKGFEVLKV